MNIYITKSTEDIKNKLGQALLDCTKNWNNKGEFFNVKTNDDGSFTITIILGSSDDSRNMGSIPLYKSSSKESMTFTFEPTSLSIMGKDIKWLLTLGDDTYLSRNEGMAIQDTVGHFAIKTHNCNDGSPTIKAPNSLASDYYVNLGECYASMSEKLNIPVFVDLYNTKFQTTYANLNELLADFWNKHFELPLDDLYALNVNGYEVGECVLHKTYGQFICLWEG